MQHHTQSNKNNHQATKYVPTLKKPVRIQRLGEHTFSHYCPGCRSFHRFSTRQGFRNGHSYNRSPEYPTVFPELRFTEARPVHPHLRESPVTIHTRCHYQISDGHMHFSLDCSHGLAGQTVRMPAL